MIILLFVTFLEKAAPQIIGSMLSALVALFIFYLGQRLTRLREKEKEAKRLADVREYFYICLLRLKKGIDLQIKVSKKLLSQLEKDDKDRIAIFRDFEYSYDLYTEIILDINKNDVFKFFIQQREDNKFERIRIYSSIFGAIEALDKILKEDLEADEQIMSNYHSSEAVINKCKDELINKLIIAMSSGENGIIKDEFYVELAKVFTKHQKIISVHEMTNIDISIKEFIYPIMEASITKVTHKDAPTILNICQLADTNNVIILNGKKSKRRILLHALVHYHKVQELILSMIHIEFLDFNYREEIFDEQEENIEETPKI